MKIAASLTAGAAGPAAPPAALVDEAVAAERDGFAAVWTVHLSRGLDALAILAAVATATRTIELGVGVVPTYPRHPVALAQHAATVQALAGGRLTLGVGVSHPPVIEGMHGLAYARPVAHMREYLTVLRAMLDRGSCDFDGEHYKVHAELSVPGTSRVPVLVGALSAGMVGVAGELADGVVTWLAGAAVLDSDIAPTVRAAAAAAGRQEPRIVAALPVMVCDDAAQGRATADQVFARYGRLENYQRLFARQGVTSAGEVAVTGDEASVTAQVQRLAAAGVTELWPIPYPDGGDARTHRLLVDLTSAAA